MRVFSRVLLRVAKRRLEAGAITQADYDQVAAAVRDKDAMASLRRRLRSRAVKDKALSRRVPVEKVDWERLADFLERLFDLILKFITALMAV